MPVLAITGASTGIGAATAHAAVKAGWQVVLGARSVDKLEALAEDLGGEANALAIRLDVTDWDDQREFVRAAIEAYGQVDAMFANAGFGAKRGFLEESVEHWRSMIDTNIYGCALTIRATLPHFRERNAGHFLLTSSVAGRVNLPGSLYSATKHAVTAMGHSLRAEVADSGIRVTLIEPGAVDTPFFENAPDTALAADDVARSVMFALTQPASVEINEILIRPARQGT
ncbi:MAG TPA: SDR family oxidoreductase [Thermoleophilaceae bacterium]